MADNVAITAGSGTTVATDDVSGVHYQRVKLAASAADSAADLSRAEDAAHTDGDHGILALGVRNYTGAGTDGDYSAISVSAAGEARTLAHRDLKRVEVDLEGTITTATTNYAAGDQVGGLMTFADMARASGGGGMIVGASVVDDSDVIGAMDIVLFRASVTPASDNAAFSISDADMDNFVGIIQLAGAWDFGGARVCYSGNLAIPYDCSGGTSLYGLLVTRFANTYFTASTDLKVTLWAERN